MGRRDCRGGSSRAGAAAATAAATPAAAAAWAPPGCAGVEFEKRILANEANNAKFNFLRDDDPYNAYYRHRVSVSWHHRGGQGGGRDWHFMPPVGTR